MIGQGIKHYIKIPTRRKNVQKDLKNCKGMGFVFGPDVGLAFDRWLTFFGHRLKCGEIYHVVSLFIYRLLNSTNSESSFFPRNGGMSCSGIIGLDCVK
jgi:hypothetical protein